MAQTEKIDHQRFRRYYQRLEPFLTKQKNSESMAAIFSLLVVSLFGWYAIRPTAQTILSLKREIADKTTVNQKMEEKITSLIEAQAAYEEISDKLPFVEEAVPKTPEAVELASQVRNLASQTGASLSAVQVQSVPIASDATPSGAAQADKKPGTFTLTTVLSGTFGSIRSFLEGLVALRRITAIELVNLKPDRGPTSFGGAPLINMVLKLSSYYTVH